jgi:ankyrin repeat protein
MKTPLRHFPVTPGPASADRALTQRCQTGRSIAGEVGRGVLTAPRVKSTTNRSGLLLFALLSLLLAIPVRLSSAAEGVNELLQKGLFEEEANHNLDAAIKAYQSVITQQDDQRKLAATAVFRLGECYRKLGRTNEAAAQYERILREFADQPSLPALSRQYLGEAASATSPSMRGVNSAQAMERKLIELRAEYDQARTLNATLKERSSSRLSRDRLLGAILTIAPDQLMEKLMAQLATAEQKLAELSDNFGPDHPDRKSAAAVLKTIQAQIDERLDAILAGLHLREVAAKAALDDFTQEWKKSREEGSAQPAAAELTDEEEKELREIKAIIKDSPDLINAPMPAGSGTRLFQAAAVGHLKVAEFLLANKADVNGNPRQGRSPLITAASRGHKTMVELLLRHGAEANTTDGDGKTPLHYAAEKSFKTVAEVLLANGADVNAKVSGNANTDCTPLHFAAQSGAAGIVELLLGKGAEVNSKARGGGTPLSSAAGSGHVRAAELLLAKGADVNAADNHGWSPLHGAVSGGNRQMVDFLLKNGADPNARLNDPDRGLTGATALHLAAGMGDERVAEVASLLSSRAEVDAKNSHGATPLILALADNAARQCAKVVEQLLANGADVNARDDNGSLPLYLAVQRRSEESVRLILAHKPDLEISTRERNRSPALDYTPLQKAVSLGDAAIAALLLESGANPNVLGTQYGQYYGQTPLLWAVQNVHKKMVEVLLVAKANVNVVDTSGDTPLHWAELYLGSPQLDLEKKSTLAEIVNLLKQAGALEDFHLRSSITVSRKERGLSRTWFVKGTNAINRYSLLELIADFYKGASVQDQTAYFPDFASVKIKRLPAKGGAPKDMDVDLDAAFKSGDCSKDLWLDWGDIVEIPERDHRINEGWVGLSNQASETMRKCLEKKVKIIVKGQTTTATLRPGFNSQVSRGYEAERNASGGILLDYCWLETVAHNCGLLRASSDLAHVKVKHHDPVTGQSQELLFDLSHVSQADKSGVPVINSPHEQTHDSRNDLWLRDGDVIEIPEK